MKFLLKNIVIIFFFLPLVTFSQQYNDAQIKTAFLYKFITNIQWPNINNIKDFKIALYGQDSSIYKYLIFLAETKKIDNLPIKIIESTNFNSLYLEEPQVIYVLPENNYQIKNIYYSVLTQPILVISDNSEQKAFSMLNFIYLTNNKISFELNKTNILDQNLKILPNLLVLGGTELNFKEMYKLKENELLNEKKIVEEQQKQLKIQSLLLDKQIDSINKQNVLIEKKKKDFDSLSLLINKQQAQLNNKNSLLESLKADILLQKENLDRKSRQLRIQKDSILIQKELIQKQKLKISRKLSKLNSLNKEITKRKAEIYEQKNQLLDLKNKLSIQKLFLLFLVITVLLGALFSIIFIKNYKQKKLLNTELIRKNNEIEAQTVEVKQINQELEKLSIVARETDNGVIIADKKGKILWVNEGFFAMIEHTKIPFDIVGENISVLNQEIDILSVFNSSIDTKQSKIIETFFSKNNSEQIWVQLTFSPFFNSFDNIEKIIVICTDISNSKRAEQEIERKNKELTIQRDKIQRQNDVIKQSILYAEKIQKALLPDMNFLPDFLDHFIIFKPKDYVSGDFYWFQNFNQNSGNEYSLIAVADCTGHGVPGALLSSIGSRLLTEITNYTNIQSPAQILKTLNIRFQSVLKQQKVQGLDGMDVVIIKIEKTDKNYKVTYTGAKRPLYFFSFDENKLIKFKSTRKTIGGILQNETVEFTEKIFIAKKNDVLYLTSDGYIDQNNPQRRRIGSAKLLQILENIVRKSLDKQKIILEKELIDWQQDELQRDDITIFGLKFIF